MVASFEPGRREVAEGGMAALAALAPHLSRYIGRENLPRHVASEVVNRREAAVADAAREREDLGTLIEQDGHRLAQFLLDAVRPGEVEHRLLLSGRRVGQVERQHA